MARTAPTNNTPNPSERWYEWNGEHGHFRYYDKPSKENVDVKLPIAFIVIGRTATVKGWDEQSESGIGSNEVRDTTKEPFVVKAFKGGPIAQGFYRDIKDRIAASGGHFVANIYIAFKGEDKQLHIGCMQLKGAALMAWSEFEKQHRKEVWEQSVTVKKFAEGKKGKVVFRTPVFELGKITKESDDAAGLLQEKLAAYHAEYFKRTTHEQVQAPSTAAAGVEHREDEPPAGSRSPDYEPGDEQEVDNVPF